MTDALESPGSILLYRSSNGDEWHVVQESRANDPYVLHRANLSSGGTQTRIEVKTFLALGNGPEQQELRRLLQRPTEPDRS